MRVLIIGGYGQLGSCIAHQLAHEEDIQLIIAGRHRHRAEALAVALNQTQLTQSHRVRAEALDIDSNVAEKLFELKPALVIHTAGPFREQGYQVASACMEIGAHYIDLATDPGFVGGMVGLRNSANDKNVLIVSGASAKPCLVFAVLQQFHRKFAELQQVEYRHSRALVGLRGQASVADLLGQNGGPIDVLRDGAVATEYAGQRWRLLPAKGFGTRWLTNSTGTLPHAVADRFRSLGDCRFFEGVDLKPLQVKLWLLSWPVRLKLLPHPEKLAAVVRRLLVPFMRFDRGVDIYRISMRGMGKEAAPAAGNNAPNAAEDKAADGGAEPDELELDPQLTMSLEIHGKSGDGLYLQCIPAILLTRKILHGQLEQVGVVSCAGLISLKEYVDACKERDIVWKASA